jgi:UDPglucose 6-dehydrogenase
MFAGHDLVAWDVADGTSYPREAIAGCEFAVVCVGTPAREDGSADVRDLYFALAALPKGLPVLIRSTIPPGTTDRQWIIREGIIAHAPEFLYEGGTGPYRTSTDVPWMLLGGSLEARTFFRPLLTQVFPGVIHECTALTAELAKYTANLHWAARVTFVNEMAAICEAHGGDWEQVRAAWLEDARVNPAHTAMKGFPPGFGGRCWPKDLSALIAAAGAAGHKAEFLAAVQEANWRFQA